MKNRNVMAERYFNDDRTARAFAGEIVRQCPAQPACLNTNNRVDVWVEIVSASKGLNTDAIALDGGGLAGKRRLHHEA